MELYTVYYAKKEKLTIKREITIDGIVENFSYWRESVLARGGFYLMMMYILFVIFLCLIGVVTIFWIISKGVDCVFKGCETNDEDTVEQNESIEATPNNEE